MTNPDIAVTGCPDLSPAALAILLDTSRPPAHVRVLLLRLAYPDLTPTELAKMAKVSRSTVYLALEVSDERAPVSDERAPEVSDERASVRSQDTECPMSARPSRPRALPRSSEGDESPSPEITPQRLAGIDVEQKPLSERQRRQQLAQRFLEARAEAGHPIDPRDVERDYRRVVTALGPFMNTHTPEQLCAVAGDLWTITEASIRVGLSKLVAAERVAPKRNAGGWQTYAQSLVPADYGEG